MITHDMLYAFVERWQLEMSSFHLPPSEMSIILDDVSCLLHLLIRGRLLDHTKINIDKEVEFMETYMGLDLRDAIQELEAT